MRTGRVWTVEEFRPAYLDHPLLCHIARRLVWSADGPSFRIAEDHGLADVDGRPFTLPEDGKVSLPPPVLLGDAHAAWPEGFAAHAILQPFPQLGQPSAAPEGQGKSVRRGWMWRRQGAVRLRRGHLAPVSPEPDA